VLNLLAMIWAVSLVVLAVALALTIAVQGLLVWHGRRAAKASPRPGRAALRARAAD